MSDALLMLMGLLSTKLGMACLALAMDVHWKQVRGRDSRSARSANLLRLFGLLALIASLIFCLLADTATMAVLVWMMFLAFAAVVTALLLSWRPRLYAPLLVWSGSSSASRPQARV